jgi:hypothetical protein
MINAPLAGNRMSYGGISGQGGRQVSCAGLDRPVRPGYTIRWGA